MIMDWNENDDNAYILEVDLEYPKEIHDEHSDSPLAPENMNITENPTFKSPEGTTQTLLQWKGSKR